MHVYLDVAERVGNREGSDYTSDKVLVRESRASVPEDVYHDAARHFLDVQLSTMDVLDTTRAQSFSIGSTVLPVTFALLNLSTQDVPQLAQWSLRCALYCYILLLILAFRANTIRGLEYKPNITTLKEHGGSFPGDALKRWVANEYEASIWENGAVLDTKAHRVGKTQSALLTEASFLSVAAVLTLLL